MKEVKVWCGFEDKNQRLANKTWETPLKNSLGGTMRLTCRQSAVACDIVRKINDVARLF